jgi:2-amino-4-hydroxy-6-hydroxymethyldihydropteridine diphosphokinase
MGKAILLLGSNKGNRIDYLRKAIVFLKLEGVLILNTSAIYESPAFGYESNAAYYNIALEVETTVSPETLLELGKLVENKLNRVRSSTERYIDRTIDIDIILFDNEVIDTINLTVPHPRMQERLFCLIPVEEIASKWVIPTLNKTVQEVLNSLEDTNEVKKVNVKV